MEVERTLAEVKDLIAKGLKFDLFLKHLRKNDEELYEKLQKASNKYYTEEFQRRVSDLSQSLLGKVREIYRDMKLEEVTKEAVRSEFSRIEEKLTARKKKTRIVEICLFGALALHFGLLATSKFVGWQNKIVLLIDVVMFGLLAWIYVEG